MPGGNDLTVLPAGVFDDLTGLTTLNLRNNSLTALPDGRIRLADRTDEIWVCNDNSLTVLPAGVFDELTALPRLDLRVSTS